MLDQELIRKIKHIQLRAGHLATEALAGEYCSAFKGQGMEFDEVLEYTPGDDIRAIDWNVTARMNQPYIKRFREEREMTIMLCVDVSPSQGFGTLGREKKEFAAEFAAVIAFLAVKNNDRVGLVLFSDQVEVYVPPAKGKAHIWHIIKEVLAHDNPRRRGTRIEAALEHLMVVLKRRSLCFMLSDFLAEGYQRLAAIVARRHDLVCVEVIDPIERRLPDRSFGLIEVEDSESGEIVLVDSASALFRRHYQILGHQRHDELQDFCRKNRMDLVSLSTAQDIVAALMQFLRLRERKGRRH